MMVRDRVEESLSNPVADTPDERHGSTIVQPGCQIASPGSTTALSNKLQQIIYNDSFITIEP